MLVAINAWTFRPVTDAQVLAESAVWAGFEAIELTLAQQGLLTAQTPPLECRQIARAFQDRGLKIASLASDLYWQCNYGDPDPQVRQQALDLTRAGLDKAADLGTDALLVVPAVVGRWDDPAPRAGYADALSRSYEALAKLRADAEDRGVHIGIENVWNRFLLSPVEMRDLIDRVNSPWVGAYFDIGNAMAFGYPQDWIDILGRRIVRVHAKDYDLRRGGIEGFACQLQEGSVDWPAVIAALRRCGYDGPLTYEGQDDPPDIARHLRKLLGRPKEEQRPT
jgi:hexulose-6-phosphate isomerase